MNTPFRAHPKSHGGSVGMILGNSLAANSYSPVYDAAGARITKYDSRGPMHHIRRRMKFPWTELYHAGLSGTDSTEALVTLNTVLTAPVKPNFVWCIFGGNDGIAEIPAATSIANMKSILNRLVDEGITPILSLDWAPHITNHARQAVLNKFRMHMWLW